MILAIFSLSGTVPVFSIWFTITGFIIASLIAFNNLVDNSSNPKLSNIKRANIKCQNLKMPNVKCQNLGYQSPRCGVPYQVVILHLVTDGVTTR